MAMVITLRDDAAARASELAAAAGVTEDEVVAQLVLATSPPAPTKHDAGRDVLEAFFGCATGLAKRPQMSVKDMRRDLAARKIAGGTQNI